MEVRPNHTHQEPLITPYVQLTSEECCVIYHLKLFKLSLREIARRLNRSHSTISREVRRNGPERPEWVYWHEAAHRQALHRRAKPCHQRKQKNWGQTQFNAQPFVLKYIFLIRIRRSLYCTEGLVNATAMVVSAC